jgi:hypothetical protein
MSTTMNRTSKRRPKNIAKRTLAVVLSELGKVHGNYTANIMTKGTLLSEAREFVGHGEWGTWVEQHCPYTERTAHNYIRAFEWAKEQGISETVSDLKLTPRAIYHLAQGTFSDTAIAAILKVAKATTAAWIDDDEVERIAGEIAETEAIKAQAKAEGKTVKQVREERRQAEVGDEVEPEVEDEEGEDDEVDPEIEAMLDGPPPSLPPQPVKPPSSADDFLHPQLVEAVEHLDQLVSKPMAKLLKAPVPPDALDRVGDWLHQLAAAKRQATPQPTTTGAMADAP